MSKTANWRKKDLGSRMLPVTLPPFSEGMCSAKGADIIDRDLANQIAQLEDEVDQLADQLVNCRKVGFLVFGPHSRQSWIWPGERDRRDWRDWRDRRHFHGTKCVQKAEIGINGTK